MEESIKYTLKYLLNDELLGCFVNSIVLNKRLDRICRELDSLGFQRNVLDSFDLYRSDSEKNNASYLTRNQVPSSVDRLLSRIRKRRKRRKGLVKSRDDRYRDLTAEVGLGSMKASAPPTYRCCGRACKRAATYDSPSNEKIDRTERMESWWNREDTQDTFRSNQNAKFVTQIFLHEEKRFDESREREEGSSSSSLPADRSKKLVQEEEKIKRTTLKLIIRKARSWDCSCSISLKPIRSCRLSLPCKAGDVTKEIFKADPGLHESCLIVMKRKFEMGIYNLCSCLNDILKKVNEQHINDLRLILEIRPGYINFKLVGKKDREFRSCLFTDRVPICQSVYKRDVNRIVDDSIDSNEVAPFDEPRDTFNDAVAPETMKNINEEKCKKLCEVSFFSPCSDTSLNEVERKLDKKIDMEEENETQLLVDSSETGRSEKEDAVSTSGLRINDDTSVSQNKNENNIIGTINLNLKIDCQCTKSDNDFMSYSTMEERLDVDVDEEIKLDRIVECLCCSSCGIPIVASKIDEEISISENEEINMSESKETWNFIKNLIDEILEEIYTTKAEDTYTTSSLQNENILISIKEENEEDISCDCSMSLDSLLTRKTFCQGEINSDCDSRCFCRSKDSSSSSLDRKSKEDIPSSGDLKNEDKFQSPIPSETEEIEAPRTKDNSDVRLPDIPMDESETMRPMVVKNEEERIICNCKDFISLSIQTSRTRTSSKLTNFPTIGKSEMIILAKSWSREKWTRKLDEGKMKRKERKREKRVEILKLCEKEPSRGKLEKKRKHSFLPTEKRSICNCDISKRSGHRRRRRFKDESWPSKIKNYVSFRRSNFVSGSFCESFYTSRRSIERLKNLVRTKLRRFLSSDRKNEIDRSKRKCPVYKQKDEVKGSNLAYDLHIQNYGDSSESETLRRIFGRRKNDETTMAENSNDLFLRKTERNMSISKDKTKIYNNDRTYNLQSYDRGRCSKERRSITKIEKKSSICEDNFCISSSSSQRIVRRKLGSSKTRKKSTSSEETFEFVFDRTYWEEKTDRSSTLDEYEKSICDLGLDFRSKLEQYVSLCKNIKYSLIGNAKGNNACRTINDQ
ncbi:hypothetical protein KPH14_002345 [Odynerus spinipes]|uniref:Uncharacterized protein n=1 Tax=Odynerus spinipes TaxID=1348599 RepID=A0AAD9VPF5_9HYME|nr:hypothetical protein KPH14_002345 [Odynerus spinipes]